jgi:hypothetical protein
MPEAPSSSTSLPSSWPGKRLGLPHSGPRSVARVGRRIVAICVDWAIASAIAYAFYGADPVATIVIFAIAQYSFLVLFSGSVGHLLLGLRVVPLTPGWIGLWRPIIRTLALSLLIPAVIWDSDQRGFHDKMAGTVLVRR